jgi:hypothetical protein
MADLTLRSVKGSPLTNAELDSNFEYFTGSHAITGSLTTTEGAIISGSILISGSIIPSTDGVSSTSSFSLGSPTNAWKDIYVSNGTLFFLGAGGVVTSQIGGAGETTYIDGPYAQGFAVTASAPYSHAEGMNTQTRGTGSHAEGSGSQVSNNAIAAHAEGIGTSAGAIGSHTEGFGGGTNLGASYSHTEGYQTAISSFGVASHTEGYQTFAFGQYAHAEGYQTTVGGQSAHAEGYQTLANNQYAHAEGFRTTASGQYSHTEGRETKATNGGAHAEGYRTLAQGTYSHTEGYLTTASGFYSHAEGESNTADGIASHAEGFTTKALGNYSHTEGYGHTGISAWDTNSTVNGLIQLSIFSGNITSSFTNGTSVLMSSGGAIFQYTVSNSFFANSLTQVQLTDVFVNFGAGTPIALYSQLSTPDTSLTNQFSTLGGEFAHGEGYYTLAVGIGSHAEGTGTIALGDYSHAEGINTTSSGLYSHAEGFNSYTFADYSHAEGRDTIASGGSSHAEGRSTTALGDYSHAEGLGTIAAGAAQHVQGKYNATSSVEAAFIVGNGTNNSNRSNLIFAAGNSVTLSGSILISGSIIPATNGISSTSSFSLGSPTNAWKDIYVSNGTINFLDGAGNITSTIGSGTSSITGSLLGTSSYANVAGQLAGDLFAEVNISSAEILNMGSSSIELLPAAGANKYYDIDRIVLEYSSGSATYNFGANNFPTVYFSNLNKYQLMSNAGWDTSNRIWIIKFAASELANDGSQDYPKVTSQDLNESVILTTWTGANPTTGNGTIRALIYYRLETFGA